ncbi:MAG: sulfotransferase [Bacteroidota bacterium]|nr:sulfotransferase [Bacteroidota bacterium]
MKIKNAVIILGPGKSGTTLFNDILSLHKDLYWISSYLNKHPNKTYLALLNNFKRVKFLELLSRNRKKYPRPVESFLFWSYYIHNFHRNPNQFEPEEIRKVIGAVKDIERFQTGRRLVIKLTGPSRIAFLEEVFEDPYILWIDRDPRAIIASFYSNKWKYKNREKEFIKKSKSDLIEEYATYYNWIDKEKEILKKFRFKKVNYESLTNNPIIFFKEVCEFLELEYDQRFEKLVKSWNIKKDKNEKFRKLFNKDELHFMDEKLSFSKNP